MTQERWTAVDDYLTGALVPSDAALEAALDASDVAGLPREAVSPTQGKLLHLLARSIGAKSILEIGTLGGYSTIWLARALPTDGRLVTLEANATHAEVARSNIANAGLADIVTLHQGPALDSLATLAGPFDMIFIDADKPSNPAYLEWAVKLSRPGTLIIGDNVVRDGAVTDPTSADPKVQGVRRFIELIAENPRLDATALQTVGSKGYDGFVLALVT
ncbi:MAG: O-methyltransferase [Chloroflexi bacterium]|nr:O-methyltransferase [Chloroflexota bacterium]MDA1173832.1 O-methyltransferase [Chloroflexota bacterium]